MDYRQFYLGVLPNEEWKKIFIFCLNLCNRFKIHLYDHEKWDEHKFYSELKSIQKLDIKPWSGGKGYIEIRGILDEKTKLFFMKYIDQSLHEDGHELWDYQFLNDYREVLYVGDYTDRLVIFSENELKEIQQQEIGFAMWNEYEVCPEMLDERKKSYKNKAENDDDFSLNIDAITESISSFFNNLESKVNESKKKPNS